MKRREFMQFGAVGGAVALGPWGCDGAGEAVRFAEVEAPISWDPRGHGYAAHASRHVVEVTDPRGRLVLTIGEEQDGLPGRLHSPSVAVATEDRVFVVEVGPGRVHMFDSTGVDLGAAGGANGFVGPRDLCLTEDRLLVADAFAHRVRVLDLTGQPVGHFGAVDEGGPLAGPVSVAVDVDGRVHVADLSQGLIHVFQGERFISAYGQEVLSRPRCVRAHPRGDVFVADPVAGGVFRFTGGVLNAAIQVKAAPRWLSIDPDGQVLVS